MKHFILSSIIRNVYLFTVILGGGFGFKHPNQNKNIMKEIKN